jgi:hypothetical protein
MNIETTCTYSSSIFNLFGANNTVEFFLGIVRRAGHAIAVGLNMVEQCTIGISMTSRE